MPLISDNVQRLPARRVLRAVLQRSELSERSRQPHFMRRSTLSDPLGNLYEHASQSPYRRMSANARYVVSHAPQYPAKAPASDFTTNQRLTHKRRDSRLYETCERITKREFSHQFNEILV